LLTHGDPGVAYNIASGQAHSIQRLLGTLLEATRVPIDIQVDTARLRPSAIPVLTGDSTRLRQATGWQPVIPFEQTLQDVLADCRQRVALS
ncbi:MAG: GDP-mannose 4,6 dehydratase, partial [Armatimonadetes bacterium]|nr:GDP-mannose 4,6 dehydratase [Anaerolineae bacterium]